MSAVADRLKRGLPAAIGLALFLLALGVLRRELHAVTWHELAHDVLATPPRSLVLALLLTALNYAILTGYDFLAFTYVGKRLSWDRIALASFLAYAIANNVGFAMLSGASVRYRFYTRWGVTASELSRIIVAYATTFWLGLLLLGGLSLATSRLPDALALPRAIGIPLGGFAPSSCRFRGRRWPPRNWSCPRSTGCSPPRCFTCSFRRVDSPF